MASGLQEETKGSTALGKESVKTELHLRMNQVLLQLELVIVCTWSVWRGEEGLGGLRRAGAAMKLLQLSRSRSGKEGGKGGPAGGERGGGL